ncbi:hypothetical protein PORY_001310 [Pneumocystis oryctolagi]|uniref:Uncharacterized protein n=1 Tax=Pneumocystis oryctolagi TaxID=42067 RepID=A0ACB7CDK9_9ASCO|nr:hypothetical protein PORY_001310 [Pneumocystis oryctolagi]
MIIKLLFFIKLNIFVIFIIRIIYILTRSRPKLKFKNKKNQVNLFIVIGSGGHTAEMIRLLKPIDFLKYNKRTYIISTGDFLSEEKVKKMETEKSFITKDTGKYYIEVIPRARHVGQSWYTTPFSSILSLASCLKILLQNKSGRPDALLCNGPGSCVIVCLATIITEVFGFKRPDIIFVESFARVKSLSLSGKLLLPFADRFIVQWPDLVKKYPRVEYYGILI